MTDTVVLHREQTWRDNMPAGSWKELYSCGRKHAIIRCQKCGGFATLSDHTIYPDGRVDPSVLCPWPECQPDPWHVFVILEGWTP
jgi:hypothetical protein